MTEPVTVPPRGICKAITIAGLIWRFEPLPGRGLRITAPPGFRVNWQTGIRVMNREWTEIELELEEKDKRERDTDPAFLARPTL